MPGGKSVTLPPEVAPRRRSGAEPEVRPSPMSNFLRRLQGRVMGGGERGRSTEKKERAGGGDKEQTDEGREKSKSSSKSPARFVGQTLSRLSMRRKEKISLCEEEPCGSTSSAAAAAAAREALMTSTPRGLPPRPAISENDLRNITIRRGSNDIPITPLVGVTSYMSEDNLASAECGAAPYRTPSYVRISCTLNGYRSPSRLLNHTPISTTPTRPKQPQQQQNHGMGKSLVERRLDQLRNPRCPETPAANTSPDRTTGDSSTDDNCLPSTPATSRSAAAAAAMGNAACTPTPIKNLISHFDKMQICGGDEEQKENVQPHSLVINEQPGEKGEAMVKEKDASRLKFDDDDEEEQARRQAAKEKLEARLDGEEKKKEEDEEVEEVNHNEIKTDVPPLIEKKDEEVVVRDGTFFVQLLASTRATLAATAKQHEQELERIQDDISEPAAAILRILIGKTLLLNGKKLNKFDELVQKNLHPRSDDPQPATVDDLEGYWGLVEIELTDIAASAAEVKEWRARGWEEGKKEEEKSPSQTSRDGSDSGRGPSEASSRPSSRGRIAPAKTAAGRAAGAAGSAPSEKAKEAAERRRKEMAEMKARMRREKEREAEGEEAGDKKELENGGNPAVLMVL